MKRKEREKIDKLSQADYAVAAAYSMIQEAGGPVMLDEFAWGRKDAQTDSECGNHQEMPRDQYVSNLTGSGLTTEEALAVASLEAFGLVRDPK